MLTCCFALPIIAKIKYYLVWPSTLPTLHMHMHMLTPIVLLLFFKQSECISIIATYIMAPDYFYLLLKKILILTARLLWSESGKLKEKETHTISIYFFKMTALSVAYANSKCLSVIVHLI